MEQGGQKFILLMVPAKAAHTLLLFGLCMGGVAIGQSNGKPKGPSSHGKPSRQADAYFSDGAEVRILEIYDSGFGDRVRWNRDGKLVDAKPSANSPWRAVQQVPPNLRHISVKFQVAKVPVSEIESATGSHLITARLGGFKPTLDAVSPNRGWVGMVMNAKTHKWEQHQALAPGTWHL